MKRFWVMYEREFLDFFFILCCRSAPDVSCPRDSSGYWSASKVGEHLWLQRWKRSMNQAVTASWRSQGTRRMALRCA